MKEKIAAIGLAAMATFGYTPGGNADNQADASRMRKMLNQCQGDNARIIREFNEREETQKRAAKRAEEEKETELKIQAMMLGIASKAAAEINLHCRGDFFIFQMMAGGVDRYGKIQRMQAFIPLESVRAKDANCIEKAIEGENEKIKQEPIGCEIKVQIRNEVQGIAAECIKEGG